MAKIYRPGVNVVQAALDRIREAYAMGARVVVTVSGGKDSTVCLELCLHVAREYNKLPLDVIMRDEEILLPGTFEYLERMYARPEINMHWVSPRQAILNPYNRAMPYIWVFDELLAPEQWVRQPPPYIEWIAEPAIQALVSLERFPPPEGKRLIKITGMRTEESPRRMLAVASKKGAFNGHPSDWGAYNCTPIYDWRTEDVWKFIKDNQFDYNEAYNVMYRVGVPKVHQRIAPVTMKQGIVQLQYIPQMFPQWFDKVAERVPGIRAAAYFGKRMIRPNRKPDETWEQYVYRQIEEDEKDPATQWIAERTKTIVMRALREHAHHSTDAFPMVKRHKCTQCGVSNPNSWENIAYAMFDGDPFSAASRLEPMEQNYFRPDKPAWFPEGKTGTVTF